MNNRTISAATIAAVAAETSADERHVRRCILGLSVPDREILSALQRAGVDVVFLRALHAAPRASHTDGGPNWHPGR